MKKEDVYGEPIVYVYKNCIARVRHPILTEEEREKRIERIKQAVVQLFLYGMKTEEKSVENNY